MEIYNSWQLIRISDFIQTRFAHGNREEVNKTQIATFIPQKPGTLLWLPSHSLSQQTSCSRDLDLEKLLRKANRNDTTETNAEHLVALWH